MAARKPRQKPKRTIQQRVLDELEDDDLSLENMLRLGVKLALYNAATSTGAPVTLMGLAQLTQALAGLKTAGGGQDQLAELMEYLSSVDDDLGSVPPGLGVDDSSS